MSTSKSLSAHDRLKGVLFEQLGLAEDTHFYVAYSGGVDSTVLLYLMRRLKETMGFSLTAMHVDHGLNSKFTPMGSTLRPRLQGIRCAAAANPLKSG